MIALLLPARAEGQSRFVTRLQRFEHDGIGPNDAILIRENEIHHLYSSANGLLEINPMGAPDLDGDVIAVDPTRGIAERLIRADSSHNTFLVTERCDQLCLMCSQPPKKTHVDRFDEFKAAALLAPKGETIGISGGEPTLYKEELFALVERVVDQRPDLSFHILSNGQHFTRADIDRLASSAFTQVTWGIPLYSNEAAEHDAIVLKPRAYARLLDSFCYLLEAGARIELRTVLLRKNVASLPALSRFIATHLSFISQWSIMQLEHIGFAKNRFAELYVDHRRDFDLIAEALDVATLYGVPAALFNFPRCSVPTEYRSYAVRSISDWKRKYAPACDVCNEQSSCCGFFEWHPDELMGVEPL